MLVVGVSAVSGRNGLVLILYLCSKMNSPTTIGNAVEISCPTNSWERLGGLNVNEGPGQYLLFAMDELISQFTLTAGLYHGGRTWIVYSASHCASQYYSLGTLELTGWFFN